MLADKVNDAGPWFLNPVILPALVGFVGVIIGGLITGVANFGLAVWKEKTDRAREKKTQIDLLHQAARLVSSHFTSCISQIERTIQLRKFPNWAHDAFKDDSWVTYKTIFASTLSSEQWHAVHVAEQVIQQFGGFRKMVTQGHSDATIGDDVIQLLTDLLKTLTKGRDTLNEFA